MKQKLGSKLAEKDRMFFLAKFDLKYTWNKSK